ncbi:MAG: hypothetical protein IIW14_03415 [Kiritimatiellae bacterium]|nr:hypothetical protein [Kiritimatiellia bacterium]
MAESDREIFDRINALESNYAEMKGMLAVMSKGYNRSILFLGVLALFGWLVVAYGAIGKEGMASVRQTLPAAPSKTAAIPWQGDDLDRWRCRI